MDCIAICVHVCNTCTRNALESDTNAKKLSMIVYPSSGGSQISIMCYHQNTGFKFDTIKSVLIRGIRFVGCGKNIASTLFISNTVGSSFDIPLSGLSHFPCVGRAIASLLSNISIDRNKFVNNSAEISGAILFAFHSYIDIRTSNFTENHIQPHTNEHVCSSSSHSDIWNINLTNIQLESLREIASCEGQFYLANLITTFHSLIIACSTTIRASVVEQCLYFKDLLLL